MSIDADASEGVGESFRSFVEELRERASVETVYGDPIESHGRTVLPVARVAYGFGGGFGRGGEDDDQSTGAGGGGGVAAKPAGALEISDDGTRFVQHGDRRRLGVALVAGLLLGLLLGRRRSGN